MIYSQMINLEVLKYVYKLQPNISSVLQELEEKASVEGQPIVSKDAGYFLHLLVKLTGAKRILEVGCNLGDSAMGMTTALPSDGKLDTIEISTNIIDKANSFFAKQGVEDIVKLWVGPALQVIPKLEGPYDMMFIDAAKQQYKDYLSLALPKIRKGGLIIVDNVLWKGKVAEAETPEDDKITLSLQDFNEHFTSHPELDAMILTIGDGLGFGVKK